MKIRKYILAIGVLSFVGAEAAVNKSEFFYQAEKQQTVWTPSIQMNSESGHVAGSLRKISDQSTSYKMILEHGVAEALSVGLELKYRNGDVSRDEGYTMQSEGLEDLQVNVRGSKSLNDSGAGLHYGMFIRHSLKREKEIRTRFEATGPVPYAIDPHSAGSSVTPYIGYSNLVGSYLVGARLMQTVWGTPRDRVIRNEGVPDMLANQIPSEMRSEERGGGVSEIKVFGERNIDRLNVGMAAKYRYVSAVKQTAPVQLTTTSPLEILGIEVSPTYRLSSNASLVGYAGYSYLLNSRATYAEEPIDGGQIVEVSLGARYGF